MYDKKSDYYTGATNYEDVDGKLKTFTYVDHDIKTKVGGPIFEKVEKKEERKISEEEQICLDIVNSHMNEDERFIEFYDGKFARKWEFKRYHEGSAVQFIQLYCPYYEKKYFADLKKKYDELKLT